jgi:hypothetical protein
MLHFFGHLYTLVENYTRNHEAKILFQHFKLYILALSNSFCVTTVQIKGDETLISFERSIKGQFLSV